MYSGVWVFNLVQGNGVLNLVACCLNLRAGELASKEGSLIIRLNINRIKFWLTPKDSDSDDPTLLIFVLFCLREKNYFFNYYSVCLK